MHEMSRDAFEPTFEVLPSVGLDQQQMDVIASTVPGGADNVQDIYPLSPLQEGMLFHSLLSRHGDTYLLSTLFELESPERLHALTVALQKVIDRHDVLRTAVLWEQLARPLQVVYRRAELQVEALRPNASVDPVAALRERMKPQHQRLELRRAPLMRLLTASTAGSSRHFGLLQLHHLICDHQSLRLLVAEAMECLREREDELPAPTPYRKYIARAQQHAAEHDADAFFRSKLASVDEPTAPFGLLDVYGDGSEIEEGRRVLDAALVRRIRAQRERGGASAARLLHAAWALVVARTGGRTDVVFGTVLLAAAQRRLRAERMLGLSVNTLPLSLHLQDLTAEGLVQQVHAELTELMEYETTPLAQAQRASGLSGTTPLFTSLLNFRHGAGEPDSASAAAPGVKVLARGEAWTNYPFTVTVDDAGDSLVVMAKANRRIGAQKVIDYLCTALQSLLQALEVAPETPALALEVLPDAERHSVLHAFNATEAPYPQEKLVHELIEEQAASVPRALAVSQGERALTYFDLNAKANQLARHLRSKGVGPDELVGICLERSPDMLIALLGVLKAGGAYIPLDPSNPVERLEHIVKDARPRVLLTREQLRDSLPVAAAEIVTLDGQWPEIDCHESGNLEPRAVQLSCRNLAYVIYTSGSTGRPKGVMIEHRSLVNYAVHAVRQFDIADGDGSLVCSSFSFDLMLTGLYPTLIAGKTVHLCEDRHGLPDLPEQVLRLANLAPLKLTPSHLTLLNDLLRDGQLAGRVRVLVLGGEPLQADLVRLWQQRAPGTRIFNHYGPTEATIGCVVNEIVDPGTGTVSIGRPISNARVYILDTRGEPAPIGAIGEIYIGGVAVARGYLNQAQLTAERFLRDPFSNAPQARMYRTGDLGRWRGDGVIEFLGRNDHQVKVRGFRVELGAIESELATHPQVREAAVVAREDAPGEKRLVAYVCAHGRNPPSAGQLREHLLQRMPDYMLPSAFVMLEQLPLTPNGKLDRHALPAPELSAYASRRYEAPVGNVEEILAGIWQSLLHVERVGRQDNFFELGGHSLLVVQMMERLQRVGLSMPLRLAFECGTLAALAAALVVAAHEHLATPPNLIPSGCKQITPEMLTLVSLNRHHIERIVQAIPGGAANVQDIYPLAPLQEGMFFHHLLNAREEDVYVASTALRVESRQRLDALIAALQAVIDGNDVLRTAIFSEQLPQPVQVVCRAAALPVTHVELDANRDCLAQIEECIRAGRREMDLRSAPLLRLRVAEDRRSGEWYAVLQLHHIICDHFTHEFLVAEMVAHLEGRGLPAASEPYRSHVARVLAFARNHDTTTFFRSKLADIDEPSAPLGVLDMGAVGAQVLQARRELDAKVAQRVRAHARRLGVSSATLLHAAWAVVVARTTGRDDVVFGSVLLGRMQGGADAAHTLGMFINTLPLRLRLQDATIKSLVEQTQRELVELMSYEQASLAVAQRCSGIPGTLPLFTSILNFRHSAPDPDSQWSGARGIQVITVEDRTNYPITVSIDDRGAGFSVTVQTDPAIDASRVAGYLITAISSIVEALASEPERAARSLDILPEAERHELLQRFNGTRAAYPREELIHELFESQVARTPHALAVVHDQHRVTYAQLNARANQLARFLREQGVRPGQLVGVCVERSVDMIIALLGILKAGGAYVPLDPNYPVDRLTYMLADAVPQVVLVQDVLREVLPTPQAISFDATLLRLERYDADDLADAEVQVSRDDLVYVIYTSGSTGRPKGIAMPHGAMANLLQWHRRELPLSEGQRVLQFAALSFDVAFQEVFSTLTAGGALVLLDEWVRRDVRALAALLRAQSVDRLFLPPLMLQSLAAYCTKPGAVIGPLKDIIVAGEQLRINPEIVDVCRRLQGCRLHNHYGPTETHVVTALTLAGDPRAWPPLPTIGRPIANTQIYILDVRGEPVPVGVIGEIHIGGANVARGYLNRPELTAERFLCDRFDREPGARIYKTGDLGRWRPDGTIEYLGRNDAQVKVRGFRIELGEIEAQLRQNAHVKDAVVVAREDKPGDKRLVAYVTSRAEAKADARELREQLQGRLPDYMLPGAFVVLEQLPTTPSGKLNRLGLPAPGADAYLSRQYEAPQGELEETVARIWQELLHVQRVGRHDNFFELGGHSLLLVQVMESLRNLGLSTTVRDVYETRTLAALAQALARVTAPQVQVPSNLIPEGARAITPEMVPLVELTSDHLEQIAQSVPGGAANIQDIYPLTPLQEGMLFHHLLDRDGGETYVVSFLLTLASDAEVKRLAKALQWVIDRHCALRTAVLWDQLPCAVQVVYRTATLPVEELLLARDCDPVEQLKDQMRPELQRMDVRCAPLVRLRVATGTSVGPSYAILQVHHLTGDHESLDAMRAEIVAYLRGRPEGLPQPQPYRNHVAQALLHARTVDAEDFFRRKLADVDEPTAPFGLMNVHGDVGHASRAEESLDHALAGRIRARARLLGVSAATLLHAAWALVVSCTTARDDVVFGTVLLGRLQGSAGAHRALGLFMNTLPLRLRLRDVSAVQLVEQTQRELADLLDYEQASLALAQRCSGVAAATPLFSALLNYRWGTLDVTAEFASVGLEQLAVQSYTNYPITMSVLDQGAGFVLTVQTDRRIDPQRIIGYLHTALESLVTGLEQESQAPVLTLQVMPQQERRQVVELFNATHAEYPVHKLIHQLFEEQVERTPGAVAIAFGDQRLTYLQLNSRANQLARYLRTFGAGPDRCVGLCVERGIDMVVAVMGILKAGSAYVPLDPNYPQNRLEHMLKDSAPVAILTQQRLEERWSSEALVIAMDTHWDEIARCSTLNLDPGELGINAANLAYVIYTSGSTGQPKGVALEHRNAVNLICWAQSALDSTVFEQTVHSTSLNFDLSVYECFVPLSSGGSLRVVENALALNERLDGVTLLNTVPSAMQAVLDTTSVPRTTQVINLAGEPLKRELTERIFAETEVRAVCNLYGPTETTTYSTWEFMPRESGFTGTIGRPLANTEIYILDSHRQPVPVGVVGEIYIGGAGVARGYLNRAELTAERFIPDPFVMDHRARVYRTGDLGRWRPDGTIECLGRNDDQVKIRGFRIELGEIESQLALHVKVNEAVVVAREDIPGEKRLVAYVTTRDRSSLRAEELRSRLQEVLPEYMLPSAFVVLDRLPLTPSGKLNRRALPAPELEAYVSRSYAAPQGDVEELLATIWQELLHVERVGRSDNFFELGGESLLAMKLMVKIAQARKVQLPLHAIFINPTIQQLALLVGSIARQESAALAAPAELEEFTI